MSTRRLGLMYNLSLIFCGELCNILAEKLRTIFLNKRIVEVKALEKIANWIAENPYLTAAGLLATFLGLIIAIITPIFQRRRKSLFFSYSTTPLVKEDVANIDGIEILFHGSPVEQLSVSSVHIWNGGNTIITPNDFYRGHELELIPPNNISILGIDMLKQSVDTIECEPKCSFSAVSFSFQAFEKKEYVSFNVYHTGNAETVFDLTGKIKEGKIVNKTVDIEKQISLVMDIGSYSSIVPIAAAIVSFFSALFTLFTLKQHKKNNK